MQIQKEVREFKRDRHKVLHFLHLRRLKKTVEFVEGLQTRKVIRYYNYCNWCGFERHVIKTYTSEIKGE